MPLPATPPILAVGDPHGNFKPAIEACLDLRPEACILLGDCDLERPLREEMAPVFDAGIRVLWIPGNHDADREHWHDHLFLSHPEGNLHGRVVTVGGWRIAGLGGVFRYDLWYPKEGDEEGRWRTREDFLAAGCPPNSRWRDGLPLKHRATIFPEDINTLSETPIDILVTHEAPTSHEYGFGGIDLLAEVAEVKLVIHGHLHTSYDGQLPSGARVKGLGRAEPWVVDL